MAVGRTQNVVILEAELTFQERVWYIQVARQFGWTKLELLQKITANVYLEILLDLTVKGCYTEEKLLVWSV